MNNSTQYQQASYRGRYPSDENGKVIIVNPERGFRYENMILLNEDLINPFSGDKQNGNVLLKLYKKEIIGERYQIVQQYIYLTEYINKDLDDKAIELINYIFSQAKIAGVKLLVRFVYKYANHIPEPGVEKIKQHMRQLKPVLANGVIYAFQFGWIGTWGEQHGSCYTDQQKQAIYRTFYADFMPANRKITMRYKANRDMLINALSPLLDSDTLRIGFNNDYYTLDAHKFAVGNDFVWQSAVYNDLKKIGANSIYDVEMPYNDDGRDHWCLNTIPADFGWGTIWRFTELGASTFSIIHNLNLCIAALRKAVIDLKQFENAGFVCDRDYFWDQTKQSYTTRSAFEYIRDHLGYRLTLEEATYPVFVKIGDYFALKFSLKNYGFARPVNNRPIAIVFLDEQDEIQWQLFMPAGAELCAAGRGYIFSIACQLGNIKSGKYLLALWLPDESPMLRDCPQYDIQLANGGSNFRLIETEKHRFNVFAEVQVIE
ncbi:DUF4874 domain-containing protein [Arsenophonus nasoniae]|uniref:DUF4874 domain-containing protein n=1 Tax=Arsenophonus nasoniae TaxID=638 RepID=A0AA95K5K4_9GAMM|nr:DUF4874 domain-containing protein [Arsenophonus nasoniae]WGM00457.1 DUF4874 domain-containing protein [Arsenophonus nasoniae]